MRTLHLTHNEFGVLYDLVMESYYDAQSDIGEDKIEDYEIHEIFTKLQDMKQCQQ
tara:strand:- start:345 stop:509 length:165 start_codon:yes stop_codon:yes gene_type:complete